MIYLKGISTLVAILLLFRAGSRGAVESVCVRGLSVQVMSQRLPRLDDGRVLHIHVRPLELCESRGGCAVLIQCCFTSTETMRLVRDGEPRAATSTITQLLSSERSGIQITAIYLYPHLCRHHLAVLPSVNTVIVPWACIYVYGFTQ